MQIIPVIDLMGGVAVHARQGQRERYRPLQTPLCEGASPRAVIDGLLGLHGFDTCYIADLGALTGQGGHGELLGCLQAEYPGLRFWIDQGWPAASGAQCVPVVGSESLGGRLVELGALRGEFILSLDFAREGLLGPQRLLEDSSLWPERVIVMSLACVGANAGPDFQRLETFRAKWPEKTFIAAGGVRNADDLQRLEDLGVSGVLLASALHSGALGRTVLRRYS